MALRDRLHKPGGVAIPANPANLRPPEPRESQKSQQSQAISLPEPRKATPDPALETEVRAQLHRIMGTSHRDFPEALALALADPGSHLEALRRTTSDNVPEAIADDLDELRHLVTRYHDLRGTFIPDGAVDLDRLRRIALATVGRELAKWRGMVAELECAR